MSVCKYYLRGHCRFEDRCRLEHRNPNESNVYYNQNDRQPRVHHPRAQFNPNYNYVAQHSTNRNHHDENPTAASGTKNLKYSPVFIWITDNFPNKTKALDILQQLQTESIQWLKSSVWRFTSRSLFPGGQPLDGWNDQSFEELKWTHRSMTSQDQGHVYRKAYSEYWESTQRQLLGLSKLDIDTLNALKNRIDQFIASNYKPSKTLATDVEMQEVSDNRPASSFFLPETQQSTNYTPDDQLLEDERAAFESDVFEFGRIPVNPPSRQFC